MATKGEWHSRDAPRGLIPRLTNTLLKPVRLVLSKPARRAYLTTILLFASGFTLFLCAVAAYFLFYWSYIPRIGFDRVIHLQFDNVYHRPDTPSVDSSSVARIPHPYPYGTVNLAPDFIGAQSYDIVIELTLPRSRDNLDAGNFMLEASLHGPSTVLDKASQGGIRSRQNIPPPLASARRPGLMPFRSYMVEQATQLSQLHWYLLGWRQEDEKLRMGMFERLSFPKSSSQVPTAMTIEVQSTRAMQISAAKAHFRARFTGLRWVMYNHRVLSAVMGIGGFWAVEMVGAAIAWAFVAFYLFPSDGGNSALREGKRTKQIKSEPSTDDGRHIKQEYDEDETEDGDEDLNLSDTERTFPTTSRQTPLRYTTPQIKKEEEEEETNIPPYQPATPKGGEADDEEDYDEDADYFLDSGIGTSMESSVQRRESIRRRRGRLGPGEKQ